MASLTIKATTLKEAEVHLKEHAAQIVKLVGTVEVLSGQVESLAKQVAELKGGNSEVGAKGAMSLSVYFEGAAQVIAEAAKELPEAGNPSLETDPRVKQELVVSGYSESKDKIVLGPDGSVSVNQLAQLYNRVRIYALERDSLPHNVGLSTMTAEARETLREWSEHALGVVPLKTVHWIKVIVEYVKATGPSLEANLKEVAHVTLTETDVSSSMLTPASVRIVVNKVVKAVEQAVLMSNAISLADSQSPSKIQGAILERLPKAFQNRVRSSLNISSGKVTLTWRKLVEGIMKTVEDVFATADISQRKCFLKQTTGASGASDADKSGKGTAGNGPTSAKGNAGSGQTPAPGGASSNGGGGGKTAVAAAPKSDVVSKSAPAASNSGGKSFDAVRKCYNCKKEGHDKRDCTNPCVYGSKCVFKDKLNIEGKSMCTLKH